MKKRFHLEDPKKSKWYIAAVIACFATPASLVLLVFTIEEFKHNIKEKNHAILFSGIALSIFAATYGFLFLIYDSPTWTLYSIMVVPQAIMGLYLLIAYGVHARFALRNARCLSLVRNDHITSLSEIGTILGLNEKQTKKCVQRLIASGDLSGAAIDETTGTILFAKSIWAKQKFVCKNCGAALIVDFGHTLVCEYCGQALPVTRN